MNENGAFRGFRVTPENRDDLILWLVASVLDAEARAYALEKILINNFSGEKPLLKAEITERTEADLLELKELFAVKFL